MAGLTPTGFETKTIDEIIAELETALRVGTPSRPGIDPNLDTSPNSLFGILIGILAEREHQMWIAQRDTYESRTPRASGQALTDVALLTGTKRLDATHSIVVASVNLDPATVLPAGSRASVDGDSSAVFETIEEVENATLSPANRDVRMSSVDAGPVRANSGTLTVIDTVVVGWNSVTNAEDATLGRAAEEDPDLRERRVQELASRGSTNLDAIESAVADVDAVIEAKGFENDTAEEVDGVPPHAFEIIVWSGNPPVADDDEIAQAIWDNKPAGIQAYGSESGDATDSREELRAMGFSRADFQDVYLEIDITVDGDYPVDGDDQVAEALSDYGADTYRIGSDVIPSALYPAIFSVAGVVSVDALRLGFSSSPVGTTALAIGTREIALLSVSRIEVSS